MAFRPLLAVAYAPDAAIQSAIGTALNTNKLTARFNARTQNPLVPTENVEEIFDCTGQYKIGEVTLYRYARLALELESDVPSLAMLVALAYGAAAAPSGTGPYTHGLSPLGATTFDLPVTTMVVQFADGSDAGVLWKDVFCNSFRVRAEDTNRLDVTAELVGNGDLTPATGFAMPECPYPFVPLRLTDGTFSVNSVNRLAGTSPNTTTRSYEYNFNNNVDIPDMFPLASLDIKRVARGLRRTWTLAWIVEGIINDALHALAKAKTDVPASFRVGISTAGITFSIPHGLLKQSNNVQTFAGGNGRSALDLLIDPLRIPGNAATPMTASVVNAQATGYLL